MSAILKIRGHSSYEKVSGKGSPLILENDHTSSLLQMSGGTGMYIQLNWGTKSNKSGLTVNLLKTQITIEMHFISRTPEVYSYKVL